VFAELYAHSQRALLRASEHPTSLLGVVHDVNSVWLTVVRAIDKCRGMSRGARWLFDDGQGGRLVN
jgi:hypothetical protein